MRGAFCAYLTDVPENRSTAGAEPSTATYSAEVTAIGGRTGFAQSSDSRLRLELCRPSSAVAQGKGTNPEQLLAAAYASCFLAAIREAAAEAGLAVAADANVTARVELGQRSGDCPGLAVSLIVDLPGIEPARRRALVERAHAISPCSDALRRSVTVSTIVD